MSSKRSSRIRDAPNSSPEARITLIASAPSTMCQLVMIVPSDSSTMPVPLPIPSPRRIEIWTIDGMVASTTWGTHGSAMRVAAAGSVLTTTVPSSAMGDVSQPDATRAINNAPLTIHTALDLMRSFNLTASLRIAYVSGRRCLIRIILAAHSSPD